MKHLCVAAILSIVSTISAAAFANGGTVAPIYPQSSFDGFYGGISGGVVNTHGYFDTHASAEIDRNSLSVAETYEHAMDVDGHEDEAIGRVDIGFGHTFNSQIYLGVELGASTGKRRISGFGSAPYDGLNEGAEDTVTNSFSTRVSAEADNGEWTVDLKPGLVFSDHALLYGRIGAAFNKVKMNSTTSFFFEESISDGEIISGTEKEEIATHDSCDQVALRLGLGLAYLVSRHIAVNLDYTYTDYGRLRASAKKDITTTSFLLGKFEEEFIFPDGFTAHASFRKNAVVESIVIRLNAAPTRP